MAQTNNFYNDFVGRTYEIGAAIQYFSNLSNSNIDASPKYLVLHGESGIGKTKLAACLANKLTKHGLRTTKVIDLKSTSNRTLLSLFITIAADLGKEYFSSFFNIIDKYSQSTDLDRRGLYSKALEEFKTGIKNAVVISPVVIILDTLESVSGTRYLQSLLQIFQDLNGKCGFILAGQIPPKLGEVPKSTLKISGFLKSDIEELASFMYEARGKTLTLSTKVYDKLLHLTNGKPVLCAIAIDWFIENEDQIEYVTNLKKEVFEVEIINCIKTLNTSEVSMIEAMAVVTKRFSPAIAAYLKESDEGKCANTLDKLKRFSFVKSLPEEGNLSLHDEIASLIRRDIPQSKMKLLIKKAIEWYSSQNTSSLSERKRTVYVAEQLHYELAYDIDTGIKFCDYQMQLALESFDYDSWNLLLNEAAFFAKKSNILDNHIELNKAEMLLTQYNPLEAKSILESVENKIGNKAPELHARLLEGYGNIIINPCTIEGADLFKAVEYFNDSIAVYEASSNTGRMSLALFELGKAYVYIGQNVEAEKVFKRALSISNDKKRFKLSAKILDEMGKMYRLQQRVEESLEPLQASYRLRTSTGDQKNLGIYHYYLANTYRDLDNFDEAEANYQIAESLLLENNDSFKLCELYCDKSWMNCLSSKYKDAEDLLAKSWDIAREYNFGTEFSEYYHIKYEISVAQSDYASAYQYLDQALIYAKKYSNIYIILDCLNHAAQRAYATKQYNQIPVIITEMENYDKLGCGIKVFTGRAKMVLGDYYFDSGRYKEAFNLWLEGLITVALYGNSRSNIEVFADIFDARISQLKLALKHLDPSFRRILSAEWNAHKLADHFPSVIDLCSAMEGQ